jgi:hypothetical protein
LFTVLGDKEEKIAGQRIFAHLETGDGKEAVKALSHINGDGIGPDLNLASCANHERALKRAAALSMPKPATQWPLGEKRVKASCLSGMVTAKGAGAMGSTAVTSTVLNSAVPAFPLWAFACRAAIPRRQSKKLLLLGRPSFRDIAAIEPSPP